MAWAWDWVASARGAVTAAGNSERLSDLRTGVSAGIRGPAAWEPLLSCLHRTPGSPRWWVQFRSLPPPGPETDARLVHPGAFAGPVPARAAHRSLGRAPLPPHTRGDLRRRSLRVRAPPSGGPRRSWTK
ncbi:hypothetical protein Shyhy01_24170 [Streptomyces hygroscopicus subsp. hygroscopicus]|nr:hypothetical protein Shyhy01_24170 [Streptomyces hygroscopicus subsp. hygroscopicus]